MALWSTALPLTASCLSSLPGFKSQPGASEEVASDLRLGGGFCWVLQFPPPLPIGYSRLRKKKGTEIKIPA